MGLEKIITLGFFAESLPTTVETSPRDDVEPGKIRPFAVAPAVGDSQVVLEGDMTDIPLFFGYKFRFNYKFSPMYIREQTGQNSVSAVTGGRLQLRSFEVAHSDTSHYKIKVTPKFRSTSEYEFSATSVGEGNAKVGDVPLDTGEMRVPVNAKNDEVDIEIESCSHLPCNLQSATWEGEFNQRARRI